MTKTCTKCGQDKDLEQFYRQKLGKYGRTSQCKECCSKRTADWYKNNAERHRETSRVANAKWQRTPNGKDYAHANYLATREHRLDRLMFRTYGLTRERYDIMVLEQGNKCKICKTTDPGTKSGRWVVEHNHLTGAVRGLTCMACNSMLGYARDNPDILRAGAIYLEGIYLQNIIL